MVEVSHASKELPNRAIPRFHTYRKGTAMTENQSGTEVRFPQPGDIVLYGGWRDGRGVVVEVPAIVLEVQTDGKPDSQVGLKTFAMGHEMEVHREVSHTAQPMQGCWRWRPGR